MNQFTWCATIFIEAWPRCAASWWVRKEPRKRNVSGTGKKAVAVGAHEIRTLVLTGRRGRPRRGTVVSARSPRGVVFEVQELFREHDASEPAVDAVAVGKGQTKRKRNAS